MNWVYCNYEVVAIIYMIYTKKYLVHERAIFILKCSLFTKKLDILNSITGQSVSHSWFAEDLPLSANLGEN